MVEDDDIILRAADEDGKTHQVGLFSRRKTKRELPTPTSQPDVVPLTDNQKVRRTARRVVESSVKVTEEQANAEALEHISNAAVRLSRNDRIVRKQKSGFSIGAALAAKLEEFRNRGNG